MNIVDCRNRNKIHEELTKKNPFDQTFLDTPVLSSKGKLFLYHFRSLEYSVLFFFHCNTEIC